MSCGESHHHRHYQGQESNFRYFRPVTSGRRFERYQSCGPGPLVSWPDRRGLGDFVYSGPHCLHVPRKPMFYRIAVGPGGSIQRQVAFS